MFSSLQTIFRHILRDLSGLVCLRFRLLVVLFSISSIFLPHFRFLLLLLAVCFRAFLFSFHFHLFLILLFLPLPMKLLHLTYFAALFHFQFKFFLVSLFLLQFILSLLLLPFCSPGWAVSFAPFGVCFTVFSVLFPPFYFLLLLFTLFHCLSLLLLRVCFTPFGVCFAVLSVLFSDSAAEAAWIRPPAVAITLYLNV